MIFKKCLITQHSSVLPCTTVKGIVGATASFCIRRETCNFGWTYRAMRVQWDELFKRRLGFERLTPSGLRSGSATDALLAGGLESARLRLRHLCAIS